MRPDRRPSSLPHGIPHSRAVRSSPAVRTSRPSGEMASVSTPRECPANSMRHLPDSTSHTRGDLSMDAVTARRPSDENAAATAGWRWPSSFLIREPERVLARDVAEDAMTFRRERQAKHVRRAVGRAAQRPGGGLGGGGRAWTAARHAAAGRGRRGVESLGGGREVDRPRGRNPGRAGSHAAVGPVAFAAVAGTAAEASREAALKRARVLRDDGTHG